MAESKLIFSKKKWREGFTLVELLVVITVISVLVGLAMVSFGGAQKQARDGERKSDLEQIRGALEMYRADESVYPTSPADLSPLYIKEVPKDPLTNDNYAYNQTTGSTYTLCAALEIDPGGGVPTGCGDCGENSCNYKVENP